MPLLYLSSFAFLVVRTSPLLSLFFFLMIRRPPRSTLDRSSAASDVYKRQLKDSLFNEDKNKVIQELQVKYETNQNSQVVLAQSRSRARENLFR